MRIYIITFLFFETSSFGISYDFIEQENPWKKAMPNYSLRDRAHDIGFQGGKAVGEVVETVTGIGFINSFLSKDRLQRETLVAQHRLEYRDDQLIHFLENPLSYIDQHLVQDYYVQQGQSVGKKIGRKIGAIFGGWSAGTIVGVSVAIPTFGIAAPIVIPARYIGSFLGGAIGHTAGKKTGEITGNLLTNIALYTHNLGYRTPDMGGNTALERSERLQHFFLRPAFWSSKRLAQKLEKLTGKIAYRPVKLSGKLLGRGTLKIIAIPFDSRQSTLDQLSIQTYNHNNAFLHKKAKERQRD